MTGTYKIKKLSVEDVDRIAELHLYLWKYAYRNIFSDEELARLQLSDYQQTWRSRFQLPEWEIEGVFEQDAFIGFVAYGPTTEPGQAEISHFYLHPDYWGTGYAYSLMDQTLEKLGKSFSEVVLWVLHDNTKARRFYDRFGFMPTPVEKKIQKNRLSVHEVLLKLTFAR